LFNNLIVHQFGLFQFRTGSNSIPPTPVARSKAAIFGLDAISRNLFNARPGSAMGDFFAGSINGRRSQSRSTASRSSMYTQTTSTMDSMKSSLWSGSTATAATTISTMDGESVASRSSKGKKLKKTKSRECSPADSERGPHSRNGSTSRTHSRASSLGPESDYSDVENDTDIILTKAKNLGSDYHLDRQLALARQNSLSQHGKRIVPADMDVSVAETIYEGAYFFRKHT
jgi:hypothetical protein